MYKEIKHKKISSKEINNSKIERKYNKNILTKKNENKQLFTIYNNNNTETKTIKKESNSKINHINLKNIIKKIDLFSISLYKKPKNFIKSKINKKKDNKKQFTNFIKLKNNKIKESLHAQNNSNLKEFKQIKKNSPYFNNNDKYINFESLTESENRYNKKDFLLKYNQNINTNININKLFSAIKIDYLNMKNSNNNLRNKKNNNQISRRHFRRNNTELGKIAVDSKNSMNNIRMKNSSSKNNRTGNSSTKNRKALKISNNNSIIKLKEKNKNFKINEEFKRYILKGKSESKNRNRMNEKKLYLITHGNKIKPKYIYQKENFKKSIPKPANSHINLKLNKSNKENSTEVLKNILSNTSFTIFKEEENENIKNNNFSINNITNNDEEKVENNFIDNALINIRGTSIPGKDSNNQIKLNQDSYIIKRDINNIKNFNFFGVFDGHGYYGQTISIFLKENLIKKIEENEQIIALNNLEDIYKVFKNDNFRLIKNIFNEIDNQILNEKNEIDTNLSGSTCNIILQIGDHIICSNTGDSRAILVYEDKNTINQNNNYEYNNYKVYPLSNDCKPNLPQEKERILKKGGIISKLKDSSQKEFGPLRIFLAGSLFPGLSMSRSFGDKLGKKLGIIVEPLIKEYKLNQDVKYIIIASDGIWEFMNNEQVMSIGNKYYSMNDPDNFCKMLVIKSTELWRNNCRNIDDITLIVIFFTFL